MTKKTAAQRAAEKVAAEETAEEFAKRTADAAVSDTENPVGKVPESLPALAVTESPSSELAGTPPDSEWAERKKVLAAGRRGKHRRDNYTPGGWPEREKSEKMSKLERENAELRRRLESK